MNKRWFKYKIADYEGHNAKYIIARNIVRFRFENLLPEATTFTNCPLSHNTMQLGRKVPRFRWDLLPPFSRKINQPRAKSYRRCLQDKYGKEWVPVSGPDTYMSKGYTFRCNLPLFSRMASSSILRMEAKGFSTTHVSLFQIKATHFTGQ
jgi:hypothetical protein